MWRRCCVGDAMWDNLLKFFDRPIIQRFNLVLVILLLSGILLISCLTMGWHNLCEIEEECQARDTVYIAAVHVVNSIADYLILISLPWRLIQTKHVLTGEVGRDWHGRSSSFVFFHIPKARRKCIMLLLLWNALFHYCNHLLRIVCYRTYNAHIRMPGLLITNILVVLSATCLFSAHAWIGWECWQLVKDDKLAAVEFYEKFRRMKKHYPLDDSESCEDEDDKLSATTHDTPPESLASHSDDDFDDIDLEEATIVDLAPVCFGEVAADRLEV